jgi:hypothetical protein
MGVVLLIVVVVLLVGAGGGYWGFRQYGGPGVGGAIVGVVIVFFVIWLVGGLSPGLGQLGSAGAPFFVILGIH